MSFMKTVETGEWAGTVGDLYEKLEHHGRPERSNWPKSPRGLTDE